MMIAEEELSMIVGGATSTVATLVNSLVKLATLLLELGRNVGSALKGKRC